MAVVYTFLTLSSNAREPINSSWLILFPISIELVWASTRALVHVNFRVFRLREIVIACNNGLFSVKHKVMSKCACSTPLSRCCCNRNEIRSFHRWFFCFSFVIFRSFVRSFVILFQSIFIRFTTIVVAQASKIVCVVWLAGNECISLSMFVLLFASLEKHLNVISCFAQCFSEWLCLEKMCISLRARKIASERTCKRTSESTHTHTHKHRKTHLDFYSRDCSSDKIECKVLFLMIKIMNIKPKRCNIELMGYNLDLTISSENTILTLSAAAAIADVLVLFCCMQKRKTKISQHNPNLVTFCASSCENSTMFFFLLSILFLSSETCYHKSKTYVVNIHKNYSNYMRNMWLLVNEIKNNTNLEKLEQDFRWQSETRLNEHIEFMNFRY